MVVEKFVATCRMLRPAYRHGVASASKVPAYSVDERQVDLSQQRY